MNRKLKLYLTLSVSILSFLISNSNTFPSKDDGKAIDHQDTSRVKNKPTNIKEGRTGMPLKTISTNRAPAAIGPYSQAIEASGLLFVSGQLGLNPETGEFSGTDIHSQARQSLENLKSIITAVGLSLNNVAAVDVFLTDMENYAAFNTIYQEYFSEHKPARAVVAVKELPKGGCVEIKCIVVRNH